MGGPSATLLVSVIMPTHNRADLIGRAIRSVLGQTYAHLEMIVVDDASSDDTPSVVRAFDDPRLRYIRLERNSRAAAARNAGIKVARGELLAFQDDDDEWLECKLDRQVQALLGAAADVGLVLGSFQRVTKTGTERIGGEPWQRELDFTKCPSYADFSLISTPNWLLRSEVLGRAGLFDERLKSLDDWELVLRILDVCRYAHLDEVLWTQRQDSAPASGMARNDRLIAHDYPLLLETYGNRWSPRTRAQYCFQTGRMLASLGQSTGRAWLWRAVRNDATFLRAWALLAASVGGVGAMHAAIHLGRRFWHGMRLLRNRANTLKHHA